MQECVASIWDGFVFMVPCMWHKSVLRFAFFSVGLSCSRGISLSQYQEFVCYCIYVASYTARVERQGRGTPRQVGAIVGAVASSNLGF